MNEAIIKKNDAVKLPAMTGFWLSRSIRFRGRSIVRQWLVVTSRRLIGSISRLQKILQKLGRL